MISRIFGCCDDIQSIDKSQLSFKQPFQKRGSRFIEVTTDPLNKTACKMPLTAMKNNKTYTQMKSSNLDTKDSNSLRSTHIQNTVNVNLQKPCSPIGQLTSLIESNVFNIKGMNKNL